MLPISERTRNLGTENAFVVLEDVDAASKTYAMPGWRVGYAVNRRLAPMLSRWITNTDSCAPHMSQWALVEALTASQACANRMREAFGKRRDLVVDALNEVPGVRCTRSGGAFYAWPNVTALCRQAGAVDSEALRRRILDDAGVALLADQHFGPRHPEEGEHLRLSFAASIVDLEEGLRRLSRFARSARRATRGAATTTAPAPPRGNEIGVDARNGRERARSGSGSSSRR